MAAHYDVERRAPQFAISARPRGFGSHKFAVLTPQPATRTIVGAMTAFQSVGDQTRRAFPVKRASHWFRIAATVATILVILAGAARFHLLSRVLHSLRQKISYFNVSDSGLGNDELILPSMTGTKTFTVPAARGPIESNSAQRAPTAAIKGAGGSSAGTGPWVMGYYASWQKSLYPINRIDFRAMTHLALVHWMTTADGTVEPSQMDELAPSIISRAHADGVKAVMMLGGSDDANFASAASPAHQTVLVREVLSKIDALGLDGVDLDWELKIDDGSFSALAQALRRLRPSLIITAPIDPTLGGSGHLAAALAPYCDQVNMMSYGGGTAHFGWVSWYFSALAGDDSDHPASLKRFVGSWLRAGVPREKVGIGIGFYARGWTAPVNGPLQSTTTASVPINELPYATPVADGGGVLSWFYNQPGTKYVYDSGLAQQPAISIPGGLKPQGWNGAPITWVTYEDEGSIAAKAAFVKANHLGGAIIWTLNEGATDPVTGRNPQLDAAKLSFLNRGPAPMPLLSSKEAYTNKTAQLALTGLPADLARVAVVWRGGGTSFDENVYHDNSYGRPSEYYIEASADGTKWTTLTHVTNNTYNTRQFLFDIAGKAFTKIRMRVTSLVGTYDGRIALEIHDARNGSADTYLFLGDSITCNCWGAADFPKEAFGPGVHAQRPSNYPVISQAGTPSLLSESLLSTSPYGVPVIRKWLNDFPSVKYVGLSYGTNDANGNVTAAAYCSNLQTMVQEVIAAGKTPIIPTIVASPSANVQVNAPAMNACLATLKKRYPSIVQGPDLWTVFHGHSVADGWFFDHLHPSLTTGCAAWKKAWIDTVLVALYPE